MKRLLKLLTSLGVLLSLSTTTISCNRIYYDTKYWLVTDGGSIKDQGFNQYSYQGLNNFVKKIHNNNNDWNGAYYELPSAAPKAIDFINGYKTAKLAGAKTFVLPGFRHISYLPDFNSIVDQSLLLDCANGAFNYSTTPLYNNIEGLFKGTYDHVVGVIYESEISAFKAGIASILYRLANNYNEDKDGKILSAKPVKLGTYGGFDSSLAVNSYMWGLISSYLLLHNFEDLKPEIQTSLKKLWESFRLKNHEDEQSNKYFTDGIKNVEFVDYQQEAIKDSKNYQEAKWYSFSFDLGGGKGRSQQLTNAGANIILPVAGAETLDTLNWIRYDNSDCQVIGVDTPSASVFGKQFPNLIITSAEKLLDKTTVDVLDNLKDHPASDDDSWLGKTIDAPTFEKSLNWVGIETSSKTNKYAKITEDQSEAIEFFIDRISNLLKINFNDKSIEWYQENGVYDKKNEKNINFPTLLKNNGYVDKKSSWLQYLGLIKEN